MNKECRGSLLGEEQQHPRRAARCDRRTGGRIFTGATHPLSIGRWSRNLAGSPFEEIVVTDTIPPRPGAPPCVRVVSCAELLTDSIRRILTDDSVSEALGGKNHMF